MITLSGTILISGPEVPQQLMKEAAVSFEYGESNLDFMITANNAEKNGLVFDHLWLDFSGEPIKIYTDARDENPMEWSFNITIKGENDKPIELTLSIGQARAIAELLSDHVRMYELHEKLLETKVVKAIRR